MSNSKMTRRALLTSVMALMLCFAMLTGTTFAWFTDQETSANNRIVAGNLDVDFLMYKENAYTSIAGGVGDIFSEGATANSSNATLWEPGATHVAYLAVENKGDLAFKYNIALNITDNGLADALQFVIVDGFKYEGTAVSDWATLKTTNTPGVLVDNNDDGKINLIAAPNGKLAPESVDYFALVVHMKEEAGNEYMGKDITIDVIVQATQVEAEADAFGTDYDKESKYAYFSTGATNVDTTANVASYTVTARNAAGTKIAEAIVPTDAVDNTATSISIDVEEVAANANLTVAAEQSVQTFDVSVTGLKDNNLTEVQVQLRVGTGLTGLKLYHYETEIPYTYVGEYIVFSVTEFSPFSIVYDTESVPVEKEEPTVSNRPTAKVVVRDDYVNNANIEWSGIGGFAPKDGLEANLDVAYSFGLNESVEDAQNGPYSDWYCDFYVSLDRDLTADQLFLAGSYDIFEDIGFHVTEDLLGGLENATLPANTKVGLLAVATDEPYNTWWTYGSIAGLVGEFVCGAGDVSGALAGATITVELRLTNPEDPANDYFAVEEIEFKFPAVAQ